MKTGRWLVLIGALTLALALIRAVFGESRMWILPFMLIAFLGFEYARNGRKWVSAIVGALIAAAVYALFVELIPADTASKQLGLLLLALAVGTPFLIRATRDRRGTASPN
jgi:hypothetical protein